MKNPFARFFSKKPKAYLSAYKMDLVEFGEAVDGIKSRGFDLHSSRESLTRKDLKHLLNSEILFVTNGWRENEEALTEVLIANQANIAVHNLTTGIPVPIHIVAREEPAIMFPKYEKEYDPEKCWEEYWKVYVYDENGELNLPTIKRLMADCLMINDQAAQVYSHVTGGKIKTYMFFARAVIQAYEKNLQQIIANVISGAVANAKKKKGEDPDAECKIFIPAGSSKCQEFKEYPEDRWITDVSEIKRGTYSSTSVEANATIYKYSDAEVAVKQLREFYSTVEIIMV